MKKVYTYIFFFLPFVLGAQGPVSTLISFDHMEESFTVGEYAMRSGSSIFCEDFDNGFDGNNGLGDWFVQDNGGNEIWYEGASGGPSGPLTGVLGPIDSPSAENGYAIFDADLWNDPSDPQMVTGSITSPSIDMSEMGSVIVDFYQSYIYCCVADSPFSLEVSVNNGVEWTVFSAHGDFPLVTNELSPNDLFTSIDISCLAAGESNVKLKWSFNRQLNPNITHYFWMIDDICVHENEIQNDLSINQVTNGDISEFWEYYRISNNQQRPLSQGGIIVGTMISNKGVLNQENAQILIEFLNEDQTEVLNSNTANFDLIANPNSLDCPQIKQDTIYLETGFNLPDQGIYWIRSTITLEGEDENAENNVMLKKIELSDYGISHTEGPYLNEIRPEFDDDTELFDASGVGVFYRAEQDDLIKGVRLRFGTHSEIGAELELRVYFYDEDLGLENSPYEYTEFTIEEAWIPGGINQIEIPLDLINCIEIVEGQILFLALIQQNESELEFTLRAKEDFDVDNSTRIYKKGNDGEYFWFDRQLSSPAIEIRTDCNISVSELFPIELEVYPNPAFDMLNFISSEVYKLERCLIVDASGRVIYEKFWSGSDNLNSLDVSWLKSGLYFLRLHTSLGLIQSNFVKR